MQYLLCQLKVSGVKWGWGVGCGEGGGGGGKGG